MRSMSCISWSALTLTLLFSMSGLLQSSSLVTFMQLDLQVKGQGTVEHALSTSLGQSAKHAEVIQLQLQVFPQTL